MDPSIKKVLDIKSVLLKPALTSHYEVYIKPPTDANKTVANNNFPQPMEKLLMLSCSDASLPGSSIMTHELSNDYTGVTQRHAYRRLYDDQADFSFYVNHGYDQIRYFEAWMRYICGEQVSDGKSIYNNYRVRYPKSYKSESISIIKFERNLNIREKSGRLNEPKTMKYDFINAFPISITSMPISYEASQLLKVTVSFSYDRYIAGNLKANQPLSEPAQRTPVGVPQNPSNLTPVNQASINANFTQNINLFGYSPGSFTNTNTFTDVNSRLNGIGYQQTSRLF